MPTDEEVKREQRCQRLSCCDKSLEEESVGSNGIK